MRVWALCLSVILLWTAFARARTPEEIRAAGALLWTGDQEGGGPYVYPRSVDDANASADEVTGFEVELAERLATRLGVRAVFVQAQWSTLPEMVRIGKADLVLNGYELSAALAEEFAVSAPYYRYGLQLLRRRGDGPASWSELRAGMHVGVLLGSAAERELRARAPEVIVDSFDGNTDAMSAVVSGRLAATVQDTPIVAFYGSAFPTLEPVGEPIAPGGYIALAHRRDAALIAELDAMVDEARASGELERIYRKYRIWDAAQREPAAVQALTSSAPPVRGLAVITRFGGQLLQSAGLTVLLSVCAFPLALLIGLGVALGRLYGPRWLRAPLTLYVEVIRGTPLLLQLYFLFFVLPQLGLTLPAFATAVLGLALNYSAYEAEIQRAGLLAVPPEQLEAALVLGMSRSQALRHVVLPQAFRIVLPPSVNDFIALFKDTSVCSAITLVELTKRYSVLALSTQATLELMAVTATLYLLMSVPLALLAKRLDLKLSGQLA